MLPEKWSYEVEFGLIDISICTRYSSLSSEWYVSLPSSLAQVLQDVLRQTAYLSEVNEMPRIKYGELSYAEIVWGGGSACSWC